MCGRDGNDSYINPTRRVRWFTMPFRNLMRRIVKTAFLFAAAVIVAAGIGLLALGSGRMNPYLRDYVQQRLSRDLGLAAEIGALRGNLLTGFRMERVRLGAEPQPLLIVDALEARYQLTALFRGAVIVDKLVMVAPRIRLPEGAAVADSTVRLLPDSDPAWWKKGPKWDIRIRHAEVVDGQMRIGAGGRVDSLDMVLGFRAGPTGYELELRRFRSLLFDPPLVIRDLTGLTLLADGRLTFEGLRLQTPGSHVRFDGTMTGLSRPEYDFVLRADSLAFGEIGRILPGTYPQGSLAAGGRVWGGPSGVNMDLRFNYGSAACDLSGLVEFSREGVAYDILAIGTGVDLARIGPQWGLEARFDAAVQLKGRGLDPLTADVSVSARIARALFSGTVVDTATLSASLRNGKLAIDVAAEGHAGRLTARLEVDRRGTEPFYELRTRLVHLDLTRVSRNLPPVADLTGDIWLRRSGDGIWRGEAGFDNLNIEGLPPAKGFALRGSFRRGIVSLDSMGVRLSDGFGVVRGHGRIDLGQFWKPDGKQPTYRVGVRVDGLEVERLLGRADVLEDVSLQIGLSGEGFHPDSMQASADVMVDASRFLGGKLDSARVSLVQRGRRTIVDRLIVAGTQARVEGRGWITPGDSLNLRANGQVYDIEALGSIVGTGLSGTPASLVARIGGTWAKPVVRADLAADSVNYRDVPIHGVNFGMTGSHLPLGDFYVRADSLVWGGRAFHDLSLDMGLHRDGLSFILGSRPDDIDHLHLRGRAGWADAGYNLELDSLTVGVSGVSLSNDGASRVTYHPEEGVLVERFRLVGDGGAIQAQGHSGQTDGVVVSLNDVDLEIWSGLLGMAGELSGMLTGKIALSGTPDDPRIATTFDFRDGAVADVRLKNVSGSLALGNERANLDLKLVQSPGREAVARGEFPLDIFAGGRDDLFPDEPVQVSLESDGVDLGFLSHVIPEVRNAGGLLAMKLNVKGTPRALRQNGWVRLRDGTARIAPLNKTFRNVEAELSFEDNGNVLGRLEAVEGKGRLALSGRAKLGENAMESYDIAFQAKEFKVIDLPELKATLNAELNLNGNAEGGRIEGKAGLTRAVLRLSDFIEYPTDVVWMTSPFFRNLNCDIRVSASRNVWIRDRDLNVEISGDVDLVKDQEGLRVYGSLDSRQGRYEFQNTSFAIDRGEINFRGSSDINPDLYIIATRRVRLVSNENAVISVVVGGTLLEPNISLESDTTPPLAEADILSYLLIGRPADDVSGLMRGEGGAGGRLEGQAAVLVLGVAANQLKRTIGRRLNLDVVEIDLGMGNSATRVRAGKYFGTRFFVSYAQDVSKATGREVVVEYELLPQVTLEAQQREGNERERDRKSLGLFWKKEW